MGKFTLALGLHNHQPVGNFDSVFTMAHTKSYAPFVQLLLEHPSIRCSIHQSGILWNWQLARHPEYFDAIRTLLGRNQIEVMTGGFYEPILPAIPERDIDGQIHKLTDFLSEHFHIKATGLWLTERVWEPYLAKPLAKAGVKYLPVDDTHFLYAGLTPNQLTGPFMTEHEGHTVTLLPIQKRLRYLIPFGEMNDLFDELKRQAEKHPDGLAVYADDGEKFGVWPNTYELCYEYKWLEQFFEALEQNSDWLQTAPLQDAAARPLAGRVYLPAASYAEMLHWALPTNSMLTLEKFEELLLKEKKLDEFGSFVRGGVWRGFLAKYEEANLLHKKMTLLSHRLDAFERAFPEKKTEAEAIREHLYAGQCNCPYWHGVFGGLYLPHLRQGVYGELIAAERELDKLSDSNGRARQLDFDADGKQEVLVSTNAFSALFKPSRGGSLHDLSLKKHQFPVTDTLTRRPEAYHKNLSKAVTKEMATKTASIHDLVLTKEPNLERFLVDDWYMKRCFIDHFFTGDVDLERFKSGKFGEEGDFILEPYELLEASSAQLLRMQRNGHLWRPGEIIPVTITKEFRFDDSDGIAVSYKLLTTHPYPIMVRFGIETNFNFQAGHAHDRYVLVNGNRPFDSFLDSVAEDREIGNVTLVDEYLDLAVSLTADRPAINWRLPIYTVSQSEEGFEKVFQGTTLVSLYELTLTGQPTELDFFLFAGRKNLLPSTAFSTEFSAKR